MKTTLRKELVRLIKMLVEEYPNVVMYHYYLEQLQSGERITPFPIGWFLLDVIHKMGFDLTDETIMNHIKLTEDDARDYEYVSPEYDDLTVELKSIKLTKNVLKKTKKEFLENNHVERTASGVRFINDYYLWIDDEDGYMEEEYHTQREHQYCRYLITRTKIISMKKHNRMKMINIRDIRRGNVLFEADYHLNSFSLWIKDKRDDYVCVGVSDFAHIDFALNMIDTNGWWNLTLDKYLEDKHKILKRLGV